MAINTLKTLGCIKKIPEDTYEQINKNIMEDLLKRLSDCNITSLKLITYKDALLDTFVAFLHRENLSEEYRNFIANSDYNLDEKLKDYSLSLIQSIEYIKSRGESIPKNKMDEFMSAKLFVEKLKQ